MGFFDDDIVEEVKAEFTPVDLNEDNVQAIFERCIAREGTPEDQCFNSILFSRLRATNPILLFCLLITPPSPRKTRTSRPGGRRTNLNGRHDPVGAHTMRPRSPHRVPRAADCRPYGMERGRFIIAKRADTQVGPYGVPTEIPQFLTPNS